MAEISSKRIPYASQLILKIDLKKKKKPQKQSLQVLWPTEIISYLLHSLSVVVKHKVMHFPPNTFLSLFAVILQFEEHMLLCSDKFSTAAVCWAVEVLKIKETVERRSIADSLMWVYRTVLSTPVWESSVQEQQLAFLPSDCFQVGNIPVIFCWAQGVICLKQEMKKHLCPTFIGTFKLLPFIMIC